MPSIHPRVEVYCEQQSVLGEAPLWSSAEQALYWLDIGRKALFRSTAPGTRPRSWGLPDRPGCLAELAPGSMAIAMGRGVQRLNLDSGTNEGLYAEPPRRPGTRFNDGKVDPRGRLWVGTMQNNFGVNGEPVDVQRTDGALYKFDGDGRAHVIEEDVGIANTLAWSPDLKSFYFADSLRNQIYAYDFDADSGAVWNKRTFFESADHGVPDGSDIDTDGCLWNARWDAGVVLRITPAGKLDRVIALPVPRPTSCIFGGAGLETLFVTSARIGLTEAQLARYPLSGSVFAIRGAARGLPVPPLGATRAH